MAEFLKSFKSRLTIKSARAFLHILLEVMGITETSLPVDVYSLACKRFSVAHELGHFFMQYMETLDESVHVDKEPHRKISRKPLRHRRYSARVSYGVVWEENIISCIFIFPISYCIRRQVSLQQCISIPIPNLKCSFAKLRF